MQTWRKEISVFSFITSLVINFLLSDVLVAYAQSGKVNSPKLIPYRKGTKWGLTDTAGNFVLPPKYKVIRVMKTGHFVIRKSGKEALADKNGKLLTPFKYTSISEFGYKTHHVFDPDSIAEVTINKKKGFIDTLGREALPPKFKAVRLLGNGFFAAGYERNSPFHPITGEYRNTPGRYIRKYGLYKSGGQQILAKSYYNISRFRSGYFYLEGFITNKALKASDRDKVGFADPKGKIIIPTENKRVFEISEKFIPVQKKESPDNFIIYDSTGQLAFNQQFSGIRTGWYGKLFCNGLAAVKAENKKWGYINKRGETVIPYIYEEAKGFVDGYAIVKESNKSYFLIDTLGKIVFTSEYYISWAGDKQLEQYTKDLYSVRVYLKKEPNGIKFITYDRLDDFYSDNRLRASQNGKTGYYGRSGKLVIPFSYEVGNRFSEGLAAVRKDGRWGFIDTTGKAQIPFLYQDYQDYYDYQYIYNYNSEFTFVKGGYYFQHGIAPVKLKGRWGYINKQGKAITDFNFYDDLGRDLPLTFKDGLVKYQLYKIGEHLYDNSNTKFTIIDTTGRRITGLVFSKVGPFRNGLAEVCQDNQCGAINTNGELVIPLRYEFIVPNGKSVTQGFTGTNYSDMDFFISYQGLWLVRDPETKKVLGYVNKNGKQFWED